MIPEAVAVLTPPTTADLVTLAAAKARLSITTADSDTDLARVISAASGLIAAECRRALGLQTVAETFVSRPAGMIHIRELERQGLLLRHRDAVVTSLTVAGAAADPATYRVGGGIVWPITPSGERTMWPCAVIVVTYTAGYALPGGAPPVLAEYCLSLVAAHHRAAERSAPDVRSESADGLGSVSYFDRGIGAMVIDPTMRAGLAIFREPLL